MNNEEYKKRKKTFDKVREILKESDEDFQDGDEERLSATPPEKPNFPIFMVSLAVIKDLLDIPGDLSIIGIIFTSIFSFILAAILFIWTLGKLQGGWWKRRMIRWLWIRYVAVIFIEFLPWFKMIPATTIFILMAHYREKKIVKLSNLALEELRGSGIIR